MTSVRLESRFKELFGSVRSEMTEEQRRSRWEEWKQLCERQPDGKEVVDYWTNSEETCSGCKHQDRDWCKQVGLPCTVNPILTFKEGIIGMACMGVGYEPA
jgi:hypothetical protein